MNILRILAITATFIFSYNELSAQESDDTTATGKKWCIKDAFIISDTQSLAIYEHKKDESGVALVNNMGTVQWELPFNGCVMAISKYKDNYLVFYTEKGYWDKIYSSTKTIKQINAATVDIKSQKIIDDKVIYTGNSYVVPDFQNDPAGNFSQLLLRKTSRSRWKETAGFTLISFNADGSVTNKEITTISTGQQFIGSSAGKDGSFFIASIQNWSSITVEKFSHEGALISKLESPLTMRNDSDFDPFMRTDTFTYNSIVVAVKLVNKDRDHAFSYFGFNFDNNQVAAVNEAPLTKKTSPYTFYYFKDLFPIGIFFTTDKIIVVRTPFNVEVVRSNSSTNIYYHSGSAVVSVFNKQMKLQRDIIVSKTAFSHSYIHLFISCHINKDKLFILSAENSGLGKIGGFCYKVNLDDGTYERKKAGNYKVTFNTTISAPPTIWFKNEFIVTWLHMGFGSSRGTFRSTLERVRFDTL